MVPFKPSKQALLQAAYDVALKFTKNLHKLIIVLLSFVWDSDVNQ